MASTHVNLVRGSLNAMLALFLVVSSLLFTFAWWMREPSTSSNPWNPEFAQAVLDEHGDELNRLASSARSRENIGNWVHAEIETDSEPRKFSACADKNGNVFVLMDYNVFAECGMLLEHFHGISSVALGSLSMALVGGTYAKAILDGSSFACHCGL